MPTPAEWISALAPQYAADPRLSILLEGAGEQIRPDHCYHDQAVALLALHMLEISNRDGSSGAVASKTEGGLSISFSNSGSTEDLGATSWGRELQRLNRLCYGFGAMTQVKAT